MNDTYSKYFDDGHTEWYLNNTIILHNEYGPAIHYPDGSVQYYQHGKRHRVDGPAIENKYGKMWYVGGKKHRLDGPAIEWCDGRVEYYVDDIYVEESVYNLKVSAYKKLNTPKTIIQNGLIETDKGKFWYKDDKLHREDGPAVELNNGIKAWFLDGVKYLNEEEWRRNIIITRLAGL